MKKHNGMRPQDVVILLKILTYKHDDWKNFDIADSLRISPSEITESLNRSAYVGLINKSKRKVHVLSFREFLIYGLKYVFPAQPGTMVKGIVTAHSALPISNYIASGKEKIVWKHPTGKDRGLEIEPLYKTVPEIIENDSELYELLVIVDTLRIGRVREIEIAINELDKRLGNDK